MKTPVHHRLAHWRSTPRGTCGWGPRRSRLPRPTCTDSRPRSHRGRFPRPCAERSRFDLVLAGGCARSPLRAPRSSREQSAVVCQRCRQGLPSPTMKTPPIRIVSWVVLVLAACSGSSRPGVRTAARIRARIRALMPVPMPAPTLAWTSGAEPPPSKSRCRPQPRHTAPLLALLRRAGSVSARRVRSRRRGAAELPGSPERTDG